MIVFELIRCQALIRPFPGKTLAVFRRLNHTHEGRPKGQSAQHDSEQTNGPGTKNGDTIRRRNCCVSTGQECNACGFQAGRGLERAIRIPKPRNIECQYRRDIHNRTKNPVYLHPDQFGI